MRKAMTTLVVAALAAAGTAGLWAQVSKKIGVIDSQEILEKCAEGKKALAELQEANKKYEADVARLDDQIRQLQNRLTTQRLTLTPEAAASLQADLQKKQIDRQRAAEDAVRALQELELKSVTRIQNELIPLIEQLRKDRGLDIIFDLAKPGVVFSTPAIELTAEVIKRYDAMKAAPPAKKDA